MDLQALMVPILVTLAVGGVAWVFLLPVMSGERVMEKRRESVARAEPPAARSARGGKSRREQLEETLKELEARQRRAKKPPLSVQLSQAGLGWSKRQYIMLSAALGLGAFLVPFLAGAGLLIAAGLGFAAALGVPRWLVGFLKKRREAAFLRAFPDAVDVIVRGIKAGLPLGDCLRIIAAEAQEPVKTEFATVIETQAVGMPLGEACSRLYERIPLPEANFFGIVVAIQQTAGGNLSEALGNLSRVLRERKKMKDKIKAVSMEAKASAVIIACLPVAVMSIVYITSPNYIELLWTHPIGRVMLACCVFWMTMGVLVMRKMINFDF